MTGDSENEVVITSAGLRRPGEVAAEIVLEIAKGCGRSFDVRATALALKWVFCGGEVGSGWHGERMALYRLCQSFGARRLRLRQVLLDCFGRSGEHADEQDSELLPELPKHRSR